jgi:hypothetical protein
MEKRKAFAKWDILIYALSLLTIASLFFVFVIFPNTGNSDGFRVFVGQTQVFAFNYSDRSYTVTDGYDVTVTNDGELYTVTVKTEKGFNQITADVINKTVKVTDADCSIGKDCVHTVALTGDTGAIICVPHDLRVLPLNGGYIPPIAG